MELEESAQALAQAPLPSFLSKETEDKLPELINGLLHARKPIPVGPLVDRLAAGLTDPTPDQRRQAALLISKTLDKGSPQAKDILFRRLEVPLVAALGAEKDETSLEILGGIGVAFTTMAARFAQPKPLVVFLSRLCAVPDLLNRVPPLKKAVAATLSATGSLAADETIEFLSRGDPALREGAARMAVLIGSSMVPRLASVVAASHDLPIRRAVAESLKAVSGGPQALAGLVRSDGSIHAVRNVLSVYELSGPGPRDLAQVLKTAAQHPEATVREAAAALLNRAKATVTPMLVSELLEKSDGIIQRSAITVARDMKIKEAAAGILKIAENTEAEDLLRLICHYFRECPTREAYPLLSRLFNSKTRAFGLMKGMSDPTRVAATEALRKINLPEAKKLIEQALNDGSETVRRAAKPQA